MSLILEFLRFLAKYPYFSGGDLLVNPDIEQSHKLKCWWEEGGSSSNLSSLTVQVGTDHINYHGSSYMLIIRDNMKIII